MSPATATRRAYPKTLRCLSALVLAGALAACGSDDSPEVSATTLSPSAETTSPATSAAASTATTAAAGKTAVNQTIVDDEMGHKITIKNVVRSFPIPERLPNLKGSKELVLVEVDITAGSTYRNTVTTSAFRIITEAPSPQTASGIVAQEMTAAGYKPVGDVKTGEKGAGWIAFPVSPPNAKTLTFRYSRLAANVLNASGKSITAKDFDVPLVK